MKITITHRCGHTQEHQLYGKMSDRGKKEEWLATQLCAACWAEAKREEEAAQPVTATMHLTMDTTTEGHPIVEISLSGGTLAHKDAIKGLGYRWSEVRGGALDLISMHAPAKRWVLMVATPVGDGRPDMSACKAAYETLKSSVPGVVGKWEIDPITAKMVMDRHAERARKVAAQANIPKPVKPACYPTHREDWTDRAWNGTIYSRNRIYYRGVEETLSDEDVAAIKAYQAAREEYRKRVEVSD